jgi:SAM-dependent methyltransferase
LGADAPYYTSDRREVLPFVPPDVRRVVEVGCGGGDFGALLAKERGVEVWGVEMVPEVAAIAASRLHRVIAAPFTADLEELPRRYFDAVLFNDSLEHFPYPEPPLAFAAELLADGGVVVASIPNVRYIDNLLGLLVERDWRYTEFGILDRTHLRFFTKRSIERTFGEAGYRVRSITGINPYQGSRKIRLLVRLLGPYGKDMPYKQFVVVASR